MGTVIAVIIGALVSILLLLRDTLHKRELIGANPREYFSHPFDYELGTRLIFIKLPTIPYVGSLITIVLFFFLLLYIPSMIGSAFDGKLIDPQSSDMFVAFFEDPLLPAVVVVAGVVCYMYRKVLDDVPHAMTSIAKSRNPQDGSYTIYPEAEVQLKSTASFIFQAGNGRKRSWLLFDVLLGITLIGMVVYSELGDLWAAPKISIWSVPDNLGGNIGNILHWFVLVYFVRIIMSYVIRLSVAMWSIGKTLSRKNLLHIEPLHPDGGGGLAAFGNLGWRMASLILPIALYLLFWWYITTVLSGMGGGPWFVSAVIILALMIPVVFFLPLWGLHTAMAKAKNGALDVLSRHFDSNAAAMWKWLENEESMTRDEGSIARANIENISALYEHVSKMPVWPFDTTTWVRFGGYMLVVIVPTLIQLLT